MLSREEILSRVQELKAAKSAYRSKCERNLRLYENTPGLSLDTFKEETPVGLRKRSSLYDTTTDIDVNIIKSCVDTLTSKIAATKVRPYFNTVNGSFKDVRVVRVAQQYFDQSFEYKNIFRVVEDCFRNACIFDTGVIYVDPITKQIRNALPWQVFYRPSEFTYSKPTRVYYERKQFPTTLIPDYKGERDYTHYGVYYDIIDNVRAEIFEEGEVRISRFDADVIPFIFLHFNNPVVGSTSNSIVDLLLPIQLEINSLANTIKDASQLSPANTIFMPTGSNLSVRKFNNGIGNVVGYEASPNQTGSPVTVATPSFISDSYMDALLKWKQIAYELVGISELSISGQKPTGLESGVSLRTMEDIESDRFETQLNAVLRTFRDITAVCMKVFDPNEDILPKDQFRSTTTWGDIVRTADKMTVQWSSADALSKDPSVKLQILQALAQSGIIPLDTIGKYLEMPDLEKGYSIKNNSWNSVQTVIERCIDQDIYSVPAFVPWTLLQQEIVNTQMSLFVADPVANEQDIAKLSRLFENVVSESKKLSEAMAATMPEEMGDAEPQTE